jgi:DeoR/GlpR family transcriptional regulator of sugar metabolism
VTSFDRQKRILDLVRKDEALSVHALVEELGASPATVRRDLTQLEQEGRIVRTHGGVLHPSRLAAEPSFSVRQQQAPEEKRRIGRAVAAAVPSGATVFIDAGTTCLEAGLALLERAENTLYTNSLPLLYSGASQPGTVIAVGGEVRAISRALVGALALRWLGELRFDVAILGATGLDPEEGAFTTELSEAAVKTAAIARATTTILAADSAKLGQSGTVRFAGWADFAHWHTDDALPRDIEKNLFHAHRLTIHHTPR